MNWTTSPGTAWPEHPLERQDLLGVILLLNVPNYLNTTLEKRFIATGVLVDHSRILTSYNPFRKFIDSSNFTENILAVLVTGNTATGRELRIGNIICGRQIAYVPENENPIWYDGQHSSLHDLMVLRMSDEIGITDKENKWNRDFMEEFFHWTGNNTFDDFWTALIINLARPGDEIDSTEIVIYSLGYKDKQEMPYYDGIVKTIYDEDDNVLEDCEELLPRQWGYFICITNIENFPGLSSSAILYSNFKIFGIGSFAMFKNDSGILVFTDVRPYTELIMDTCGDEEFT